MSNKYKNGVTVPLISVVVLCITAGVEVDENLVTFKFDIFVMCTIFICRYLSKTNHQRTRIKINYLMSVLYIGVLNYRLTWC